ncbi:MAG: hypothetical protein EP334_00520 [Gammaproteobacteria bacterium]|nr:MAG: hypothetical protein EP334_00520 [Gammaproteobacteria bacterium]
MSKSLNDQFVEYQVLKDRMMCELEEAGIESAPYSLDYADHIISAAIANASGMVCAMKELTEYQEEKAG